MNISKETTKGDKPMKSNNKNEQEQLEESYQQEILKLEKILFDPFNIEADYKFYSINQYLKDKKEWFKAIFIDD